MWDLPLQTHRYLIEALGGIHLETMLFLRFTKFIQSINSGIKEAPIYLLDMIKNNTNTITGRNVKEVLNRTNEIDIFNVKLAELKKEKFFELPQNEKWRTNLIKELSNIKMKTLRVNFINGEEFKKDEINDFIDIVATM